MDNSITSLGLMSGTSLDGIDASIINSDGKSHLEVKANDFYQYKSDHTVTPIRLRTLRHSTGKATYQNWA